MQSLLRTLHYTAPTSGASRETFVGFAAAQAEYSTTFRLMFGAEGNKGKDMRAGNSIISHHIIDGKYSGKPTGLGSCVRTLVGPLSILNMAPLSTISTILTAAHMLFRKRARLPAGAASLHLLDLHLPIVAVRLMHVVPRLLRKLASSCLPSSRARNSAQLLLR